MKKRTKMLLCFLPVSVVIMMFLLASLIWNGVILLNNPSGKKYPVRGVDVSSYQGTIDWQVLSGQNIEFAFIKATEGSGFVDKQFASNLAAAQMTDLRVGAYHFFSYDSSGTTQAENFISAVPKSDRMLPPVIDVEFYGDKEINTPDQALTQAELEILLKKLEDHYGMKPIIYATEKSYDLYIAHAFYDYDIWIRNVKTSPKLSDNRAWRFWQYTNREQLNGYSGDEKYIDMNVFAGTREEFETYAK